MNGLHSAPQTGCSPGDRSSAWIPTIEEGGNTGAQLACVELAATGTHPWSSIDGEPLGLRSLQCRLDWQLVHDIGDSPLQMGLNFLQSEKKFLLLLQPSEQESHLVGGFLIQVQVCWSNRAPWRVSSLVLESLRFGIFDGEPLVAIGQRAGFGATDSEVFCKSKVI
jgi:hypothetical protein